MHLDQFTDAELLAALAAHPHAKSVRIFAEKGGRSVHAGKWSADQFRLEAAQGNHALREGPGYIAMEFLDGATGLHAFLVARVP